MRETEIERTVKPAEVEEEKIEQIYCDDCRSYLESEDEVWYDLREVCYDCRENPPSFAKFDYAKTKLEEARDLEYEFEVVGFGALICSLLWPATFIDYAEGFDYAKFVLIGAVGGIFWCLCLVLTVAFFLFLF